MFSVNINVSLEEPSAERDAWFSCSEQLPLRLTLARRPCFSFRRPRAPPRAHSGALPAGASPHPGLLPAGPPLGLARVTQGTAYLWPCCLGPGSGKGEPTVTHSHPQSLTADGVCPWRVEQWDSQAWETQAASTVAHKRDLCPQRPVRKAGSDPCSQQRETARTPLTASFPDSRLRQPRTCQTKPAMALTNLEAGPGPRSPLQALESLPSSWDILTGLPRELPAHSVCSRSAPRMSTRGTKSDPGTVPGFAPGSRANIHHGGTIAQSTQQLSSPSPHGRLSVPLGAGEPLTAHTVRDASLGLWALDSAPWCV